MAFFLEKSKNLLSLEGRNLLKCSCLENKQNPNLNDNLFMKVDIRLRIAKGSKTTREVRLQSPETVIGRLKGCGVRIPSAQVSRTHCRLLFQNGYLQIEDLNSFNGTYLNGARIWGVEVVKPGDQVSVGPVTFVVDYKMNQWESDLSHEEPMLPMTAKEEMPNSSFLEGTPLSMELLEGLEASSQEDMDTEFEGAGGAPNEDWHIPFDENPHDFLSQFDSDES